MVLRSPYIAGITLWVGLLSVAATFLYFEQAAIVAAASDDPAVRTRIFATVDLAVGLLTLAVQFVATGKLIARFGVGAALALLPLVFAVGFAVLAAAPVLAVVIAFQALQRTANFAISNPAREVLFTVVERDEKYKAKNVIDIVAVRGADAAGGVAVHRAALARHGAALDSAGGDRHRRPPAWRWPARSAARRSAAPARRGRSAAQAIVSQQRNGEGAWAQGWVDSRGDHRERLRSGRSRSTTGWSRCATGSRTRSRRSTSSSSAATT